MSIRIRIGIFIALSILASGCRARSGGSSTKSMNGAQSVVRRADGNFDVVCRDGSKSVATSLEVQQDGICQGSQSGGCWGACSSSGYAFNACLDKCGTVSESEADMCWTGCDKAGYGFNLCLSKCGQTVTGRGTAACWNRCGNDSFNFQACAGKCGTNFSSGASSCWASCEKAAYNFDTCNQACVSKSTGSADACWSWCQRAGYIFETCRDKCDQSTP